MSLAELLGTLQGIITDKEKARTHARLALLRGSLSGFLE
jgi:hypothetical protein